MSRARKILMAGGTFSVALGIGFVMQNGDALAARFAGNTAAPTVVEVAPPLAAPQTQVAVAAGAAVADDVTIVDAAAEAMGPKLAQPEDAALLSAVAIPMPMLPPMPEREAVRLAAVEADETMTDAAPEVAAETGTVMDCGAEMTGSVSPAAMVALSLHAPCNPDAALTIHHQGMMFTALTDAAGDASIVVPALSEEAVFIAAFDGGEGAIATVMVPEVASLDRAVLQWQGDSGLQIHAYEFGAEFDDPDHVWREQMGDLRMFSGGEGGFMVALGAATAPNPLMAEVYTFPTDVAAKSGDVVLTVEAEITAANCGRDVSGQSIQIAPGAEPRALDLTMTMPDCDAVGDFLVLNAMLDDIKVAAR